MKNLMMFSLLTLSASFAAAAPIDFNAYEAVTHTRFRATADCLGSKVYGTFTIDEKSLARKTMIKTTKLGVNFVEIADVTYKLFDAHDGRLRGEGQIMLMKDEGYENPVGPMGATKKTIQVESFAGAVTLQNFRLPDGSIVTDEIVCDFEAKNIRTVYDDRIDKKRKELQKQRQP